MRICLPALLASAFALLFPAAALAHGAEGGIVLLLPTGYYILGAAATVAVTFLLMSALPDRLALGLHRRTLAIGRVRLPSAVGPSLLSAGVLMLMIAAGFFGSRDPLDNPLPAFVWTVWWVCLLIAHGLFGPLWTALNPWTGPAAVIGWASGGRLGVRPLARLPEGIGYGIAILQFYGFAWFELVDLSPSDPGRLAAVVLAYWLANLAGRLVYGEDWMRRAEPFGILFGLIGRLAPLAVVRAKDGRHDVGMVWPGKRLFDLPPLPVSGVLFVLLALSTVSFDGLSRTFAWLSAVGVNPLEFPGRSAVVLSSSAGILLVFAAFAALFFGSVALGGLMAGERRIGLLAGRLVVSIVPIAVVFQFAHYLTLVLVEGQNFLKAVSDPFGRGWDLFGTADLHVTTSFLADFDRVETIYNAQTAAIIIGHVLAVVLAHALLVDMRRDGRGAFRLELPFAALMVFYTAFGLWLLSTPRI
ncbi:hypothetical protein [Mongoliimonas terrestris]|uniref:hypothetical protein n=1 Tax=Mongoliimonas terrestris TaxID=1709001 RepID=UPI00094968D4|nr:hypothetical protein [Mongoliimonas terrestris]